MTRCRGPKDPANNPKPGCGWSALSARDPGLACRNIGSGRREPSGVHSDFPTWCGRVLPWPTKSDCAGSRSGSAKNSCALRSRSWMIRPLSIGQRRGGSDGGTRLSRSTYPTTSISSGPPQRLLDRDQGPRKTLPSLTACGQHFPCGAFVAQPVERRAGAPHSGESWVSRTLSWPVPRKPASGKSVSKETDSSGPAR